MHSTSTPSGEMTLYKDSTVWVKGQQAADGSLNVSVLGKAPQLPDKVGESQVWALQHSYLKDRSTPVPPGALPWKLRQIVEKALLNDVSVLVRMMLMGFAEAPFRSRDGQLYDKSGTIRGEGR